MSKSVAKKAVRTGTNDKQDGGVRVSGRRPSTAEIAEAGITTKSDMIKWATSAQAEMVSGKANLRQFALTLSIQRHMFALEKAELQYGIKKATRGGFFLTA